VPADAARRAAAAHAQALATLPDLLDDNDDRKKLITLFDKLHADSRMQGFEPTAAQHDMLARIRAALPVKAARAARRSAPAH
jgi:ferric-dicitrate binding protein FerR (iron transport regulator)